MLFNFGVNVTVEFYELLSGFDTKRKARDPMGYHGRSNGQGMRQGGLILALLSIMERMGTPTQVCVRSCPNISAPAGRPFRCVKSKDPYEAIRQAYLDGTDTESKPFEDPIVTETLESPLTIAPPISLSESTPPVLIPILRRTARMVVHVLHAMSSGLSASMADVAAMSESALYKSEEDDDEEDEEIDESMDSDSVSEDAEDEGPTTEDEDPATEDEGLTAGVEGPGMHNEGYGLDDERHGKDDESRGIDEGHSVESDGLSLKEEEEEAVPRGQQQAAPVVGTADSGSAPESKRHERVSAFRQPTLTTWIDPEDGMIYIDIPDYPPPAPPVQTLHSPEWTYATPATVETEGFLTELGAQVEMQGRLIHDHAGENQDLRLQLAEERRERLKLTKVVDGIKRGQEP
ncbi:hypothetical protein Tco_1525923 [Tanacetum coccineum]